MKTVCFFVTRLDSGGLENYLLRFLRFKHPDLNKIFVFCRGGKKGSLDQEFTKIPNLSIVYQKLGYINPVEYTRLYSFLKKNKVETVCDFSGNMAGPVMLTAKLVGVKKRITQYRGSTDHFKTNFFKNIYNKSANRLVKAFSTKILSNSIAALDYFFPNRMAEDTRYEVIHNGLDVSSFVSTKDNLRKELNVPETAFVVGHTGRYNEAKNHSVILQVARRMCREDKNTYFILCGNHVKDNLESEIEPEFKSRIILQNSRSDVIKILNTLDCYFFPSLTEGQPNALIEAMAVGLPFVASNISPILETVPISAREQLVDPLDSDAAYAKLIRLKDVSLRRGIDFTQYVKQKFDHTVLFQRFFENL